MNETILIVDDEERIRNLVSIYLKKEKFNILQAENGEEAINIFKENSVDLILLDVMMPVMDGFDVCEEIRKISMVPIIMLTAKSEEEDQLLGFDLGIDHYITKPFSTKILVAKIKAILKRSNSIEGEVKNKSSFDGLVIDEERHEVSVDGREINLSPKEFELLGYFKLNKGIVLSREKILDTIWGIDYYGDLRTVDTVIKRLREKLGEKAYLISTVRGAGYKFEVMKNEG